MTGAWGDDGIDEVRPTEERAALQAKRFFYTDVLAAAWMAKHFGMLIALRVLPHSPWYEADDDLSGCIDMPADDIAALIRQLLDKHGSDYEPGRYYVHPHSTQLLQPQDGDWAEYQVDWKNTPHRIIVSERTKEELRDGRYPFSIKERKGVAFMWPESEDANG